MQLKGVKDLEPSNFQLMNKPRVTKSIFSINKDFDLNSEVSLEIGNEIKVMKLPYKEMSALVTLNLRFFEENNPKDIPFNLEIEIEAIFEWGKEQEAEAIQLANLLRENAPAILYSYLRPIITNISMEANLPPLIIPLMNFRE